MRRQSYEVLGRKSQALNDAETLRRLQSAAREEQTQSMEEESPSPVVQVEQQINSKCHVCLVSLIVATK